VRFTSEAKGHEFPMTIKATEPDDRDSTERARFVIRLPGLIKDDVGIGDIIKRVTSAVGIPPCGGCEQRARAFNRVVAVSGCKRR